MVPDKLTERELWLMEEAFTGNRNTKKSIEKYNYYTFEKWIKNNNLRLETQAPPLPPDLVCMWEYEGEFYETSCGAAWYFANGGPKANDVRYCQGCGKPIEMKP